MKRLIIVLLFCFSLTGVIKAQKNYLITSNSVGALKLGMTVAQARKALPGFKLKRGTDGDGVALIYVNKGAKTAVMTLYAGEENPKKPINEKAKIEFIEVWDANYKTADGIYPTMLVKDAEKILGKVKQVVMSEIESREFITFTTKPKGLQFRVDVGSEGKYLSAGAYAEGEREAARYTPDAYILSIQIADYYPAFE